METQANEDLVGQVVEDRYRIEQLLGRGAMGVVYRARHLKFGREVAIKILHDHLVCDPQMIARFDREAAVAGKLDHPNVVNVLDVGTTAAGGKLMVMELARGTCLADLVAQGPLERTRTIRLVLQLLRGLEHAHAAGLVHRDLKPENVIVDRNSQGLEIPRIVDFGIAVLRGGAADDIAGMRVTEANVALGTPAYMAPEQAYGGAPDPRSDLFALGVMVYEMLCGKQPFSGSSVEVILANVSQDPPPIVCRAGIDVDPLLEAFARKLMARELAERFTSAREAFDVLSMIERDRDSALAYFGIVVAATPPEPTVQTAAGTPVRVAPRWGILGGIVLVLLAAVCAYAALGG